MKYTEFATYIRFHTKTDSTTLTDAELVSLANVKKDDIAKEIAKGNEDIFGMWYLRDLEAGVREYSFPANILSNIKGVEACVANEGTEFKKFDEFDLTKYRQTTVEADIRQQFSGKYLFDIFRKSLWLYTGEEIIDVTDGLKLWAIQFPADLTTAILSSSEDMSVDPSTTSHGMPREAHEIWARSVIIEYKNSKEKPIPLTEKELNYENDLQKVLNALKGTNLDRQNLASVPRDTGENY
jgi:hypothetical protein